MATADAPARSGPPLSGARFDVALAAVTAAALLIMEPVFAIGAGEAVRWPSMVVLALGSASIAVQGRHPYVTALIVAVCLPHYYIVGTTDMWAAWIMFLVAVVRLGTGEYRAAALTTVGVSLAVFIAVEAMALNFWRGLAIAAWMIVVVAAVGIARSRGAYLREAEERAAEAERTREEEARRRATEERLRIARELHDVIAHDISLINVQAAAAAHRRDPDQAYAALDAIKGTSKDTLRQLRATLGVMRQVDGGGLPVAPTPSIAQVDDLAERTRAAGLPVRLHVDGEEESGDPPAPVGLAGYRIVQEALTNARRHSGASAVDVTVRYGPDSLVVEVTDDGVGAVEDVEEGNGLRGMRERAAALGGRLTAGPRPAGGFLVRVVLPAGSAR